MSLGAQPCRQCWLNLHFYQIQRRKIAEPEKISGKNGKSDIYRINHMRKNLQDSPIGVFDSGVGGLTVVREIIRQLPYENIIYFGDTARVPYGTKSKDAVIRFSKEIVSFLASKKVKLILVACNTASATAITSIKKITKTSRYRRN